MALEDFLKIALWKRFVVFTKSLEILQVDKTFVTGQQVKIPSISHTADATYQSTDDLHCKHSLVWKLILQEED